MQRTIGKRAKGTGKPGSSCAKLISVGFFTETYWLQHIVAGVAMKYKVSMVEAGERVKRLVDYCVANTRLEDFE